MQYQAIKYKINKMILPSERIIKVCIVAIMMISLSYAIILNKLSSTICAAAAIVLGIIMIVYINAYVKNKSIGYQEENIHIDDDGFVLTNQMYEKGIRVDFDKIKEATLSNSPKTFLIEGEFEYAGDKTEHVLFFDLYDDEAFDLIRDNLESRNIEIVNVNKPALPQASINLDTE